jgi:hypothetical protein
MTTIVFWGLNDSSLREVLTRFCVLSHQDLSNKCNVFKALFMLSTTLLNAGRWGSMS